MGGPGGGPKRKKGGVGFFFKRGWEPKVPPLGGTTSTSQTGFHAKIRPRKPLFFNWIVQLRRTLLNCTEKTRGAPI